MTGPFSRRQLANATALNEALADKASIAQIQALAEIVAQLGGVEGGLAPNVSPNFLGVPTAPTADLGTESGQIATTAFVQAAIEALINAAPNALDTLEELAAALGDDANFAATMTTALAGKQGLNTLLTALAGLTTAANKGLYFTGSNIPETYDLSSNGRSLVGAADYTAMRTLLSVTAIADIVNDLVTNSSVLPLSAAMGKSLKDQLDALSAAERRPQGYLFGCTLSNNATDATNDIDIAAGICRSDDDTENMAVPALTKRLDAAWAVGDAQGGRDTGSIANGTWHVWAIKRTDTGVVDILFSTSATSPTMPANYTKKRRIGSIVRASAALLAFVQVGDHFELKTHIVDVVVSNLGTTPTLFTLTVPTGISIEVELNYYTYKASSNVNVNIYSPNRTDEAAGAGKQINYTASGIHSPGAGRLRVRTNTSGQIKAVSSAASTELTIGTVGWYDTRGRMA